jgi:ABC-2 type transport system permease protein
MTKPILFLLDRLQWLFRMAGADYGQLRAIVQVKLTMDNRRSIVSLGRYGKQSTENNSNFTRILGIYTLVGGLISLAMLIRSDSDTMFFPLTLQFSYIMSLCAMTLISDFSSVILDSSDNQIILPRPVSSRTLWLARVVHITSYLFAIALSASVIGVLITGYRFGALAGLLFLAMSLFSAVLMVFLTNVFYLVLMRFISEDKLREVINYFQIVMAVVFYGGYQLLPRLMDTEAMITEALEHEWWHFLVPPMWMAGTVEIVIKPALDLTHLIFLVLAVTMPFAGLWFMNRFLTAGFTQKLGNIDQEARPDLTNQTAQQSRSQGIEQVANWTTTSPLERAAFAFTWRITGRDRKFKLKTYPQLGFGLAYVVVMSINGQSLGSSGFFYLFALYFAGIYVMVAQYQLSVSDSYRASWVYGSAPIRQPGEVLSGALKALIIKLLIPFYVLLAGYILYRYGTDKTPDVILAFFNSLIMLISAALLSKRHMPFSAEQDALKQNNTARGLLVGLVLGVVGTSHYGLTLIPYGVIGAIPVSIVLFWVLFRQYRQTNWTQIEMG